MANNWRPAELPTIVPTDVDAPDIAVLAQFMSAMQMLGVTWFPDGDLENFVRTAARLPELDEDQLEMRKQMQMRAEATVFAQANTDYVATQQGLTQQVLGGTAAAAGARRGAGPPRADRQRRPRSAAARGGSAGAEQAHPQAGGERPGRPVR